MTKKRLSFELGEDYLVIPDYDTSAAPPADPVTDARKAAYLRALRRLMEDNLTKKQKCYIILYYKEGLTVNAIAERCGVDRSTVSRTITRGRQRLTGTLGKEAIRRLFSGDMPDTSTKNDT
ncbi:RNA polymerase sigma factor [uncultured Ruminococcus sp.]|uniref:RNA polymerase sigma factor n=1 Tax=uncultured Ruminococcus sp. TaxID=165186 RepID=UPI0025EF1948|nr:sigma-70 family RNA polymerase sigma factor [uncultured Ruminococcus sp.]